MLKFVGHRTLSNLWLKATRENQSAVRKGVGDRVTGLLPINIYPKNRLGLLLLRNLLSCSYTYRIELTLLSRALGLLQCGSQGGTGFQTLPCRCSICDTRPPCSLEHQSPLNPYFCSSPYSLHLVQLTNVYSSLKTSSDNHS